MVRNVALSLLLALGCCLAACAGGPPGSDFGPGGPGGDPGGGPGGHGGPQAGRLPNVFFSPSGQPFRAPRGAPYPVVTWFAAADTDHDGKLTKAEFRADAAAFFRQLDTNHDGVISGVEVQAYEQTIAPEILPHILDLRAEEGMDPNLDLGDERNTDRPRPGSDGRSHRMEPARPARTPNTIGVQGAASFSLLNEPEPIAAADAAFDGRITLAEFLAATDHRFNRLDSRRQGYLTLADLPKTPVQAAMERARGAKPRAPPPAH